MEDVRKERNVHGCMMEEMIEDDAGIAVGLIICPQLAPDLEVDKDQKEVKEGRSQ